MPIEVKDRVTYVPLLPFRIERGTVIKVKKATRERYYKTRPVYGIMVRWDDGVVSGPYEPKALKKLETVKK